MFGFNRFMNATVIIAGIELMHRIHKSQFAIRSNLKVTAAPALWNAVFFAR
jgi:hypothetical protein